MLSKMVHAVTPATVQLQQVFVLCVVLGLLSALEAGPTAVSVHSSAARPVNTCPDNCCCTSGHHQLTVNCTSRRNQSSLFEDQLRAILGALPALQALTINGSPLQNLSAAGICRLTALSYADLKHNSIVHLDDGCFSKMAGLTHLLLEDNHLEHLSDGVFDGLIHIQNLAINYNHIHTVGTNVFTNLTVFANIGSIDLGHNNLTTLDIWPLYLSVNHGPRKPSLKITIKNNRIQQFTNSLGWIYNCEMPPANVNLLLMRNNIRHLTNAFSGWKFTTEWQALCLFRHDSFQVDVSDNPLVCDCVDFDVYKWMRQSKHSGQTAKLLCDTPDVFHNQRIVEIKLSEFVCNVSKQCPVGCRCIARPGNATFHIKCPAGSLRQLPALLPNRNRQYYRYKLEYNNNQIAKLQAHEYLRHSYYIDLSNNLIDDLPVQFLSHIHNLSQILLHQNLLSTLPRNITEMNFAGTKQLSLHGNPFSCTCEDRWFRAWLLSIKAKLVSPDGILCKSPDWLAGKNILKLSDDDFCRNPYADKVKQIVTISLSSILGTFLALFIPALVLHRSRVWLYRKYKWHPFDLDECEGEDKEFDAFVSYANEDEEWVLDLVEELEQRGFKLLFHKRDFIGGSPITENIGRAIDNSKRTVCVVSLSFLQSRLCMWEFIAALNGDLLQNRHRTIVLKYAHHLPEEDMDVTMRNYLQTHSYVDCQSGHFMNNLLYSLPTKPLGNQVKAEVYEHLDSGSDSDTDNDYNRAGTSNSHGVAIQSAATNETSPLLKV